MKGECLTFDLGESHVEIVLFENHNIPSPSSALAEDVDFHEIRSFDDWWHVGPFAFECVASEGLDLHYVRVEFNAPMSPRIVKDRICTTCLLYTSPSPRDGLLSRMPSSA